jgi:hypothetical protein
MTFTGPTGPGGIVLSLINSRGCTEYSPLCYHQVALESIEDCRRSPLEWQGYRYKDKIMGLTYQISRNTQNLEHRNKPCRARALFDNIGRVLIDPREGSDQRDIFGGISWNLRRASNLEQIQCGI